MDIYISVINEHIDFLTPDIIKNLDIEFLFIYDSQSWINKHINTLNFVPLKTKVFFFPAIYQKELTDKEILEAKKKGYDDPCSLLEMIVSDYVKFQFLPIFFYSNIVTSTNLSKHYIENNKSVRMEDFKDVNTDTKI